MAVKIEERNRANFLSDQIRNQENDDEDMDEQIVKAEAAQPRIARRQSADHRAGHRAQATVIPSAVEGSRGRSLKATSRDPSTALGMTRITFRKWDGEI